MDRIPEKMHRQRNVEQIEIDNIPNATIIQPTTNSNISGNFLINLSANSSNLNIDFVNLTIYNKTQATQQQ